MEVEIGQRFTFLGPRWYFRIVDTGTGQPLATSAAYQTPWKRDAVARRFAQMLRAPVTEGKWK